AREDALVGPIGGATADWDADGDLDVFLFGQLTPAVMLRNDGAGVFAAEPHPEWDVNVIGCGGTAAFADADLDGDIDLFYGRMGRGADVVNLPCENRLLLNDGVALVDRSDLLPPEIQALRGTAGGFHQFDADPEPELYVVVLSEEEFVGVDLLLDRQPDGRWVAVRGNGLDVPVAGMGLAAADLNDDGLTDVAIAGFGEVKYLLSVGGEIWADAAQASGLVPDASRDQIVAWGGEFADFDLDGRLDLAMTFGTTLRSPLLQPDEIWRGTEGMFEPVAAAWGVDQREVNRGNLVGDFDEDGWPDQIKRELGGVVFLDTSRCGDAAWLEIRLKQDTANPDAIGARIRVIAEDQHWDRTIGAGSTSFTSGGPPVAHFGFGSVETVDRIEVTWPDGAITRWGPADTRQVIQLERP
ncbi:MAG: CRTAC1 family protein, partial [Deltaproteobacteria bacterium]|nr:CRTAC1 family protein [Deltaproteobacteria bacterium]